MAKVWFVREGSSQTIGEEPKAVLTIPECEKQLGLKKQNWKSGLKKLPQLGKSHPLQQFRDFRLVVVEVDDDEANEHNWKSWFYFLDVSVKAAKQRL
ncbi:MAG: hypothetical protein ACT4O2_09820 [Beijerinckiaceae bacterium]